MDFTMFNRELGNADLFLIDQILKGRFPGGSKILDAGCGEGRNLNYFFQNPFEVFGIDKNASALRMLNFHGKMLNKNFKTENFIEGNIINLPFDDDYFDYILCISVLHFAESVSEFKSLLAQLLKSLKKNGILLLAMNSIYGVENEIVNLDTNKYQLKDGSVRFLINESVLSDIMNNPKLKLVEPVRNIWVHGHESNTYLLLEKI